MSEKEFVKWFKGFVEGAHHFNISPAQWDLVKDKISKVGKESKNTYQLDDFWTTDISY